MNHSVIAFMAGLTAFIGATVTADAASQNFSKPRWQGSRLDWCVNWAQGCGKEAADAFCRAKGYDTAIRFAIDADIGHRQPTRLIGTGAVCDQGFCDGFSFITCFKPEPQRVRFNRPKWQGNRLDWCVNWAQGCGKPAADAFCRAKGLSHADDFAMDADIGQRQPTRLIGTGALCDQGFCDGFSYITCRR